MLLPQGKRERAVTAHGHMKRHEHTCTWSRVRINIKKRKKQKIVKLKEMLKYVGRGVLKYTSIYFIYKQIVFIKKGGEY